MWKENRGVCAEAEPKGLRALLYSCNSVKGERTFVFFFFFFFFLGR